MTGKAEWELIFNFGSIRSYNIPRDAESLWRKIIVVLDRLVSKGVVFADDAERAKAKYEGILGKPPTAVPAPVPVPAPAPAAKPKVAQTADELVRERLERMAGTKI